MTRIFLLALIGFIGTVHAQQDRSKYIKKVLTFCPDADITEYESKTDYVEVEFLCDGEVFEMGIDQNFNIIFRENETEIQPVIMGIIQKKLNKKHTGWLLDEHVLVTTEDTSYYRFEIIKEGIEQNVYFSLEGKNFKPKGIVSLEPWNEENLKSAVIMQQSSYPFLTPTTTYDLPDLLREISGLAVLNDSIIYAVQDELGIVFKYNLKSNQIEEMKKFTDIGDFEDLYLNGDDLVVLRSDAAVFKINKNKNASQVLPIFLPINSMNVEGVYFDKTTGRTLIASKEALLNRAANERHIYSFDLTNLNNKPKIELTINIDDIASFLTEKYNFDHKQPVQFNPSAVAIHPITKNHFILSASHRLLIEYQQGKLIAVYPLPATIYYKPEGLCFTNNGDLYISSEGSKDGLFAGQVFYFKSK